MVVNFITNTPLSVVDGGGGAISHSTYQQLCRFFDVRFIGPVHPSYPLARRLLSKGKRLLGIKGEFHTYSSQRLDLISREVAALTNDEADADFFHHFTPWIHVRPSRPYFAYTDACFMTYYKNFIANSQAGDSFSCSSLSRIAKVERNWIEGAQKVYFRTSWALRQTCEQYGLSGENMEVAGFAGFMDLPKHDCYKHGLNFLFVARNFLQKGGDLAVASLHRVRQKFPNATLTIVGGVPPSEALDEPGIYYAGFLSKQVPQELDRLRELYSSARALIHPTTAETNSLVTVEAGYFGCPAVVPDSFALPEVINAGKAGMLLRVPITVERVADAMIKLCEDGEAYTALRRSVRTFMSDKYRWDRVGDHFASSMREALPTHS